MAEVGAANPGEAVACALLPDHEYRLYGAEIAVIGVNLTIIAAGTGGGNGGRAILDAQSMSRVFRVDNGSTLSLDAVALVNGHAKVRAWPCGRA